MKENNIIQNLGLDTIPEYGLGGMLRALKDNPSLILNPAQLILVGEIYDRKKDTTKKDDTVDTSSKKTKTASTEKKSSDTSTKAVTTSTSQSSTPSSAPTGNMDWMSEYGTPETTQQQEVEEREPFNAVNKVWNDEVLSKVDTAVASRYLKNNLQDLLNMYNMKVAETIGQKRS